jgi:hypothetical protein
MKEDNKKEIKVEIKRITPKIALQLLETNLINRQLRPSGVRQFANIIESGKYQLVPDPIIIGNRGHLLNGQHRLNGLIRTGKTLDFMYMTGIDEELFPLLDSGAKRTASDALFIAGFNHTGLYATLVLQYMRWESNTFYRSGKRELQSSPSDVLNYAKKHKEDLAITVNHVKSQRSGNNYFSENIFAIAFHIIKHYSKKPLDDKLAFWSALMGGSSTDDPHQHNAINWLKITMSENRQSNSRLKYKSVFSCIFHAYNGFSSKKFTSIDATRINDVSPE